MITMKKVYDFIIFGAISFATAACGYEEFNPNRPSDESGDEIQFGLSLETPDTKTIYGDEASNVVPIYWVNGDKVQIFSPNCLTGRRSAEYEITVAGTEQNYADNLTRTGEYGVQWGDGYSVEVDGKEVEGLHDFYSLYPSGNYSLSTDGKNAENVVISSNQHVVVNGEDVKSDMEDCLMYAKTIGVEKGSIVNLTYSPITTVFMMTLSVDSQSAKDFTIQNISLIAPEGTDIAGTFSLKVADGTFSGWGDSKSNKVSADIVDNATGGYYVLTRNKGSVTVPLFLVPVRNYDAEGKEVLLNTAGWQVKITANNEVYTKTLASKNIVAGKIHKVKLPTLSSINTEWSPDNWMTNIPRNVYLSEVSLPGSWNTLNPDFQGTTGVGIAQQYALGIRAFHLDTRWRTDDTSVNTAGYLDGDINGLSVAGAAESDNYKSTSAGRVVSGNAETFAHYLEQITSNITYQDDDGTVQTKQEYMVVMCTFAQDSYNYTYDDGASNWVTAISEACSSNPLVYDAKNLTQNTLIGDVLGKVIVIVNMESAVTSVPSNSKCLFVNVPLTLTSDLFGNALTDKNKGPIYKYSADTPNPILTDIEMYHHQAQISMRNINDAHGENRTNTDRGFIPTYAERETLAKNILDWSRSNYGTTNYAHNKWIYLGLGGYYVEWKRGNGILDWLVYDWRDINNSRQEVAADLNAWINARVTEMGTVPDGTATVIPYYPVGIVLMNHVHSHSTTVKNILDLNNKYRLQFDPEKPSDYTPVTSSVSAAQPYAIGMNSVDSAFGWD